MARAPARRLSAPSPQPAAFPRHPAEARKRVVIEGVAPEVDAGRFPIKRALGEKVVVEADVFADGHDALSCVVRYRHHSASSWSEAGMVPLVNDRWRGEFAVNELGRYAYSVQGWVDSFESWRRQFAKRVAAGQDLRLELEAGAQLVEAAASRAGRAQSALSDKSKDNATRLMAFAASLRKGRGVAATARGEEIGDLIDRYPDRSLETTYERELEVVVEPERARFGAWYELFPRSAGQGGAPGAGSARPGALRGDVPPQSESGRHGTFRDVEERLLPYIAGMGFDVLYLPPIHPIGHTHRKGANNAERAAAGEPGSPWAIGSEAGGHKSLHPDLGTQEDFQRLVRAAHDRGMSVALDIAFQCSPDHPYAREHPEWFRHRPDGSIQYAENPPKKYEDIYPFDFDTEHWRELWNEMLSIVCFWVDQGVSIFRVDNPHTKPFAFWEWLIGEVKRKHPEVIFLAEAFTRPKVMYRLAKVGFSQSYTYFAWRNTSWELAQYFQELTQTGVGDYFRPNLWPNTPDILTDYLQTGGRTAFAARLVLAATLGASYGIYGPAFELCVSRAKVPGSEEYLDSEKYQIRTWDLEHPDSLRELITLVNRVRRENPALQSDRSLKFHPTENDSLIAYSKSSTDGADVVLTVVNLDPHHSQTGMVTLPLQELGIEADRSYQAHELLSGARYLWTGPRNYVEINPQALPAQIFRFRRRLRSEHDFEYFA